MSLPDPGLLMLMPGPGRVVNILRSGHRPHILPSNWREPQRAAGAKSKGGPVERSTGHGTDRLPRPMPGHERSATGHGVAGGFAVSGVFRGR